MPHTQPLVVACGGDAAVVAEEYCRRDLAGLAQCDDTAGSAEVPDQRPRARAPKDSAAVVGEVDLFNRGPDFVAVYVAAAWRPADADIEDVDGAVGRRCELAMWAECDLRYFAGVSEQDADLT